MGTEPGLAALVREIGRLGLGQGLLLAAWGGFDPVLVGPMAVGLPIVLWLTMAWDRQDLRWRHALAVILPCSAVTGAGAVSLGAGPAVVAVAGLVALAVGRVELFPWMPVTGMTAEEYARTASDRYEGRGTGRPLRDTTLHDPYLGLLGMGPKRDLPPDDDPWEDPDPRYVQHLEVEGRDDGGEGR